MSMEQGSHQGRVAGDLFGTQWRRVVGVGLVAAGLALVGVSLAGSRTDDQTVRCTGSVFHLADCRPGSPVAYAYAIAPADEDDRVERGGVLTRLADWFTEDVLSGIGTSINTDGRGYTSATWSDGRNRLKVRIEGDVEFNEDDRGIKSISRGGYVAIQEKRGPKKTEIEIESGRGGELSYDYRVNGKRQPFDESAREWLGDVLLQLMRRTGIGAESRAARIYERDGMEGLLSEVRLIEGDYVRRLYLGAALKRPDLSSAECSAIVREAGALLDSDYEKAELLLGAARHRHWDSKWAGEYVRAASTIKSDYEARRALSAIELDAQMDQEVMDALLAVAARMKSDYETAELLIALAPSCRESERLSAMYVEAAADIRSDYEARRALSKMDWRGPIPVDAVVAMCRVAGRFGSGYEAAELLLELAPYAHEDDRAVDAFMDAVIRIRSDYEKSRVLVRFASERTLREYATLAAIDATDAISSAYEKSNALRKLVTHCRGNEKLEDAYLDAVDAIRSDYERDNLFSEFYRGERASKRGRGDR